MTLLSGKNKLEVSNMYFVQEWKENLKWLNFVLNTTNKFFFLNSIRLICFDGPRRLEQAKQSVEFNNKKQKKKQLSQISHLAQAALLAHEAQATFEKETRE